MDRLPAGGEAPIALPLMGDLSGDVAGGLADDVTLHDFRSFYRAERTKLARALAFTLGDEELATEAIDEAMTRAVQRWRIVGRHESPAGWVYRVALNWARSILRTRRRRQARPLWEREGIEHGSIGEPAVAQALADLDVKHRSVVVCRYLLGWSEADTAAALNMRPGTVKSRLHRATAQLRAQLGHLRDDEGTSDE